MKNIASFFLVIVPFFLNGQDLHINSVVPNYGTNEFWIEFKMKPGVSDLEYIVSNYYDNTNIVTLSSFSIQNSGQSTYLAKILVSLSLGYEINVLIKGKKGGKIITSNQKVGSRSTVHTYLKRHDGIVPSVLTYFNTPYQGINEFGNLVNAMHEGLDLLSPDPLDVVTCPFSGVVNLLPPTSIGNPLCGGQISVKAIFNDHEYYFIFFHIINNKNFYTSDQINAGDDFCTVDHNCYGPATVHLHVSFEGKTLDCNSSTQYSLLDPFPMISGGNSIYNDPAYSLKIDDILYLADDRVSKPSNLKTIKNTKDLYGNIDIAPMLESQYNGVYTGVYKLGYFIEGRQKGIWKKIKDINNPLLINHKFSVDVSDLPKGHIDDSYFLYDIRSYPNFFVTPVENYMHTDYKIGGQFLKCYVVTNSVSNNGNCEGIDLRYSWLTDVTFDEYQTTYESVVSGNNKIKASLPIDLHFKDGPYRINILANDKTYNSLNGTTNSEIVLNNFYPMIEKIEASIDNEQAFVNNLKKVNENTFKIENIKDNALDLCGFKIKVTTTEPLKEMSLKLEEIGYYKNIQAKDVTKGEIEWEFVVTGESLRKLVRYEGTFSEYPLDLHFEGKDLSDLPLIGVKKALRNQNISNSVIPKRNADGTWTTGNINKFDDYYQIKIKLTNYLNVRIIGGGYHEYCFFNPKAKLVAIVNGGVGPYRFSSGWEKDDPGVDNLAQKIVSSSGEYGITVQDFRGCKAEWKAYVGFTRIICLASGDPNDLLGPPGLDSIRWVARKDTLPYTIHFENDPKLATGPAQRIRLELPLDTEADPSSFRVGRFGFAGKTFEVPAGRIQYQGRVDARDSVGVFVDVTAGVDAAGHKAFWIFQAVDPATGLPPADGRKGLLPVNDSITNKGQGFVEFSIKARTSTVTGDIVNGKADIIFDANDVIPTNLWANVVDAVAPVSEMQASSVSAEIDSTNIPLSWTAQDDPGGCGIGGYNLYVSEDNGPFEKTFGGWQDTFLLYGAERGHTYRFFVQAADRVGNNEPLKNAAEVTVRVKSNPRLNILSVNSINLCSGDSLHLVWASEEIDSVHIAYSTDNGLNYNTVKASLRDSLGHFAFTADDYTQDQVLLLRIADAATPSKQEDTVSVVIHPRASVTITSPETVICASNPLELTASGTVSTFYWSPYYSVDVPDTNKVQVTATKTTRFFVTGRDLHGCIAVDSVDVTIHPRDSIYLESIVCSAADSGRVLTVLQSQFGCDSIILHAFSLDTLSPIAISKDTTLQLDGADQAAITPQDLNDGTFDDCSFSLSLSRSAFTCADLGPQLVWLIATDALGNQDSVASTVTVQETIKPVITCPANAIIAANAGCTGIVGVWNLSAKTDNCTASSSITESQSPASSIILSGHDTEQIVTLTAHDGSGNTETCTFTVTLKDIGGPSITCPPNATVAADANCTGIVGTWSLLTKTDNCTASGSITESQNPASSTVLSGHDDAQTVTLTAYDDHSNSGTCTFTVTLKDATKPVITCPANSIVAADANCSGTVGAWSVLTKTDNCTASGSITESQSPMGGATWSGHNAVQTVTLTANDRHGNTEACTFTLTLKDTDIPVITCPANATVAANASCGGTVGAWSLLTKTDICSASSSISESQSPASTTTLSGHNDVKTVALTANDGNGNTASCSFTVTLKDVTPPLLSCPADRTVNLNVNCQASLANYLSLSTTSDNCTATNAIVRVQSPGAGTVVSSVGVTIVTIAATDAVGNTANCTFNVARADVIIPSITCPATQSLELGTGCQAALPNYSSMATASDNCTPSGSIAKTQTSPVSGTIVSGLGTTLVTLRATDASGKTKTCTFNVSRIDNLAPFCGSSPQGNGQSQAVMTNHRPTNLLQAYQLELFPNPATTEINVSVTGNAPEGSVFEIADIMGKIIQRTDIEPLPGELIQFDLAVLPSGVYLLKWSAGGQVLAGKTFVVVR